MSSSDAAPLASGAGHAMYDVQLENGRPRLGFVGGEGDDPVRQRVLSPVTVAAWAMLQPREEDSMPLRVIGISGGRVWMTTRRGESLGWTPWTDLTTVVGPIAAPHAVACAMVNGQLQICVLELN